MFVFPAVVDAQPPREERATSSGTVTSDRCWASEGKHKSRCPTPAHPFRPRVESGALDIAVCRAHTIWPDVYVAPLLGYRPTWRFNN